MALGGFAGLTCLLFGLGTPAWHPLVQTAVALGVAALVGGLIVRWRRHLPPDLALAWIGPAEAAGLVQAGPPPDRTLLYVGFAREWGRRFRLDVLVDGQRVGQLPPGTGLFLPLRPGTHEVSAYLDRPSSTVRETVNGIPGGYAGFTIRNIGTRSVELAVRRDPSLRPVLAAGIRLVRPAVPEA